MDPEFVNIIGKSHFQVDDLRNKLNSKVDDLRSKLNQPKAWMHESPISQTSKTGPAIYNLNYKPEVSNTTITIYIQIWVLS